MISVVLPSFLGEYSGCAADRPAKLRRAIESFLTQGIGELIIVPDGCEQTVKIASEYPVTCLSPLVKSTAFSGLPRNRGIEAATNDYIAYLDSDDVFGENHLTKMVEHLDADWLWWDDYVNWDRRSVSLGKGLIGTSCIAHKKSLGIVWGDGYAHDWGVVEQLMKFPGKKIETSYRVMHIPGVLDI